MKAPKFCPDCGVTLDFHDGPDSCEDAEMQAERLENLSRMMFWGLLQ